MTKDFINRWLIINHLSFTKNQKNPFLPQVIKEIKSSLNIKNVKILISEANFIFEVNLEGHN